MSISRLTSWMVMAFMISNFLLPSVDVRAAEPLRGADSVQVKPVNVNKASLEELQTVRGIGPALAERIVSYREANSGFKSLEELKEVRGIGDMKFERIKSQLTM